jgi:uncharacterized hydrophobic protein (TIGR00271 family)
MSSNKVPGIWQRWSKSLSHRFNLHLDKADEEEVVYSIKKNADFVGANLWTLIFAIFIASIGLNVNSTAVIIGAMLISPVMGPIMGVGLGIGINDFELVKKGGRNLIVATIISVITSTFYFWLTPLHDAQTELLARTTPSVWDVFIAFFGGLAGIVAGTRKEKSNVIPGVAIATALMPPLCTAGFGLATGNFKYFISALYLFFINSVFICLSTYLIVRFLKFRKKQFADKITERRVSRYMLILVVLTVLPSVYLGYGIVQKSIFETNAQRFVRDLFRFKNTQVVSRNFTYKTDGGEIDLLLIGEDLSRQKMDSIRKQLSNYNLAGTRLLIRQGLNAKQEIDFTQIKASILEDVFRQDSSRQSDEQGLRADETLYPDIRGELQILFPQIKYYSVSALARLRTDTSVVDTITTVLAATNGRMTRANTLRFERWLKQRWELDTLHLVLEP